MILFKNKAETMEGVLGEAKHATDARPRNANRGDIILIAQTKDTLRPGQKPIRWMMNFVSCEEDVNNESDRIWGRHWRYIINGENVRPVEPFDIDEIKISSKNYGATRVHAEVNPEDEAIILGWISESIDYKPETRKSGLVEFKEGRTLNPDEIIKELDAKYANTPEFKETVTKLIRRPSALSNAIKEKFGYQCMICKYPGFEKKSGGKYAEVHHMIELNKEAPKTLQSWNLLVVCPLCHKKLHYADVKTEFLNPGWKILVEGKEIRINPTQTT
jgi:5-methylcytosine-specific restriction protein A